MSSNEENRTTDHPEHERCHGHHVFGRRRLWKIPFIAAAILLVHSAVIMAIWNALIPDLFHGPTLSYLQAMGLKILVTLFVGFSPRRFGGWTDRPWGRHLSPEDREKLRERLRQSI